MKISILNKYQYFLKPEIIITVLIFFFGILALLQFETFAVIKYTLLIVCIFFLYLYFVKKQIEFLIYPLLYLIFFASYNLYYSLSWSLWSVMLIFLISFILPAYLLIDSLNNKSDLNLSDKFSQYFYMSLLCLVSVEIFLTLIPWPTDPRGKSIILLIIFYILQGLIIAWLGKKFDFKHVSSYILIGALVIFGVIITTSWYAY